MDACEAVEKEVDKVIKKFTEVKGESVETINEIISVFSVLLNSLGKQRVSVILISVCDGGAKFRPS